MEKYKEIDMDTYLRKNHFDYFNSCAYPYMGLTCNVNITRFENAIKSKKYPFFLSFLWCVSRAANGVDEFRQRIEPDGIIEFEHCLTSHTVAKDDGTYVYCTLDDDLPFFDYIEAGKQKQNEAKLLNNIDESKTDVRELFYISTLPWLTYTAIVQPVPCPTDSNPRITWDAALSMVIKHICP